ncbi:MAG: ATP-binding protein [Firmicutes bacterium]|nr:ATP-binding protein [Bacillota bacterium]
MYLKRKADAFLKVWKEDSGRKPLIIKGARQVGKTETIRHFAHDNYESVVEINFYEEPIYRSIIENGFKPDSIINRITRIDPNIRVEEGKTLLFFDEIQECPDIATSLKFFKQDGRYDVICSGSLLGLHYNKITSVSVGYKTDYEMFSMDFEEYLWARGYDCGIGNEFLEHMKSETPFSQMEMQVFMDHFIDYCALGGMPAVVKSYIETNRFSEPYEIQKQLLLDYEEDARKYAEGLDQTKIISVMRSIPSQLAKENKKFQYAKIRSGARSKDYFGCVEWLHDAGIINICYCLSFPELPLKGNYDGSKFKIYYSDTGLLVASLDEESQQDLRANKALGIYKGALYENFAADAFRKEGLNLFYYKREDSTLEQDFFVRKKDDLIPVEVKAQNAKAKSMRTLINSEKYQDIKYGIKLTNGNIGYSNNIYTFPYFCTFLLKKYLSE